MPNIISTIGTWITILVGRGSLDVWIRAEEINLRVGGVSRGFDELREAEVLVEADDDSADLWVALELGDGVQLVALYLVRLKNIIFFFSLQL